MDHFPEPTNGEGNGNPLQYSCLENCMARGALRATDHGVTKCGLQLSTHQCIKGQRPVWEDQGKAFSYAEIIHQSQTKNLSHQSIKTMESHSISVAEN